MLADLPTACDVGSKKNSKGYKETWIGYKLHLDVACGQIPVSCVLTSASVHDICGRPSLASTFFDVSNDMIGCGHMSGLLVRYRTAGPDDIRQSWSLSLRRARGSWRMSGCPGLSLRPCRSSRLVALAKLEPVILLGESCVQRQCCLLTPSRTSRRGSICRSSSSPRGSGPACWPAPP